MIRSELIQRAEILKQHEDYAYQTAYYLLEDEALAARAATDALAEMMFEAVFFSQEQVLRQQLMKRKVIRKSLSAKAAVLNHTLCT
ncbi:hypothetical protein [Paenibacillus sinopodophylli]|uniref:hypothetical protein n=1 Tax=Paenibacillus sinopodophylli TaxID=1837342 RepID=UPI00110D0985|nr:hypothetical protein [Paenibacillus sinopodophylli]